MIVQLVFQVVLLMWPINTLAQTSFLPKPSCPSSCGRVTIPFPFGIGDDCYIDEWFAIECRNNSIPFIRSINLEVVSISLEEGTVMVNYPIFSTCKPPSGDSTKVVNNLEGSPFVFSQTSNRFTALGCNNLALMISSSNESIIGGCMSVCDKDGKSKGKGCYGNECCQTSIPSNLKTFRVDIGIINNDKYQGDYKGCRYAFLIYRDWFEKLRDPRAVLHMEYVHAVLDWGLDERTFNAVRANNSYIFDASAFYKFDCTNRTVVINDASPSNSSSVVQINDTSSSNHTSIVFNCFCDWGFEGNPYLLEGCQDIDECKNASACPTPRICRNFYGSYDCYMRPKTFKVVMLGVGTGLVGLFLIVGAWCVYKIVKRRKIIKLKKKYFKRNGGLLLEQQLSSGEVNVDKIKMFNSNELEKATDHFDVNRVLGQGGQGTVYKGMLVDGSIVAVKKSKVVDEGKLDQFINEVVILSQINHRNVVKLFGCCLETDVPLLVYEFIPTEPFTNIFMNKMKSFH